MKKITIFLPVTIILFVQPSTAQDLPTKDIMLVEGLRSLVYGFYAELRQDKSDKTVMRMAELFGKSLLRAIPSAAMKAMAVPIAQKSGMAPLGQLMYRKGELLPNQDLNELLQDWRIRYSCFEFGTNSPMRFNPRYFLDMASIVSYGYLTEQNMQVNVTQSLYAGKPIFGKRFKWWHAVSSSAAVLGY